MKPACKSSVAAGNRSCNDGWSREDRREAVVGKLFSHHPIINLVQMLP
jgi:hypothetical protein